MYEEAKYKEAKYYGDPAPIGYPSPSTTASALGHREELTIPLILGLLDNLNKRSSACLSLANEIKGRLLGVGPEHGAISGEQTRQCGNGSLEEMRFQINAIGENLERIQDAQNAVHSRIT